LDDSQLIKGMYHLTWQKAQMKQGYAIYDIVERLFREGEI